MNECLQFDNQCSDGCLDLQGTYRCTCPKGKYLDPVDRYSCKCKVHIVLDTTFYLTSEFNILMQVRLGYLSTRSPRYLQLEIFIEVKVAMTLFSFARGNCSTIYEIPCV